MKIANRLLWASTERALLGENPIWDADPGHLYWIDAADPAVYRKAGDKIDRFAMPKPVAAIFLGSPDHLIVAMRQSFVDLDMRSGRMAALPGLRPPSDAERFNDGRCDPSGRVWISTMDHKLESPIGSLQRIDTRAHADVVPTHAKLGNGVCFSPDGATLYFSDTVVRGIFRYPVVNGQISSQTRALFAQLDDAPGRPDGCCVDTQGHLWSARVGGGRIDRYAPDGSLVGYLEVGTSHPTHCAFGGPDLQTLYVTTSRFPVGSPTFEGQPLAGITLAFDLGGIATGLAEARVQASALPTPIPGARP